MVELNSMENAITPLLYRAAHRCSLIHNEVLKEYSISMRQAVTLAIITYLGAEEVNQKKISDITGVKESSVSSIIKTMIKNGFIYKEQSKNDSRNNVLKITKKGLELEEKIVNTVAQVEEEIYGGLSEQDKTTLRNLLLKLV